MLGYVTLSSCAACAGLDPAEPSFEGTDPAVRLDPTDAAFVDVIHTDCGPIVAGGKVVNIIT